MAKKIPGPRKKFNYKNDLQELRRSQFIFTYGPGALIESKNGPVIIPKISNGLSIFQNHRELEKFIHENNTAKWFCGFNLTDKTPDFSVFTRIRQRIGTSKLSKIFQDLRS